MGAALSLSCVNGGGRQLLQCAQNGDTASVREILAVRPELAAYTYFASGQNIAHVAAGKGDREVLQAVVDVLHSAAKASVSHSGGDMAMKEQTLNAVTMGRYLKDIINAKANNGLTPLMLACEAGHISCVNFLLDSGVDVFEVDKAQRRSAIHYAAAAGQAGVLRSLLSTSQLMHTEEGLQPLKSVLVHDMSGQCRYIDSRAENGVTALHLAAIHGELACVNVLLAAGASMMVRTVDLDMISTLSIPAGSTPLHLAAQKGQVAIVQAMLQAHADALGNWAREEGNDRGGRRGWEQDGRIDLRSVANSLRQLPYHVAWQRGFREAAQALNPTIAIDAALENVRELDQGFGTQRLATLAAYALRKNLVVWLEAFQVSWDAAEEEKEQRILRQKVITEQRKKEALKIHSQKSVEASLAALDARLVSPQDAGHTFALPVAPQQPKKDLSLIEENSDELLSTMDWGRKLEQQAAMPQPPPSAFASTQPDSRSQREAIPEDLQAASPSASAVAPSRSPQIGETVASAQPPMSSKAQFGTRKSKRRFVPSRPPPPPPINRAPSATERALAMTAAQASTAPSSQQKHHSRRVSWEDVSGEQTSREASSSSPTAEPGWMCSPFASPFAEASRMPLADEALDTQHDSGSGEEGVSRHPLSAHPSGVDLVDPPEGDAQVNAAPLRSITSRRSSRSLLGALPSFRSKRSQQLKNEPSGRVNFQRAASIPGFDNNLDDDDDCGICLDEPVNVGVAGCSHKLCVGCALKLCQVNKKPPLCPFCRTFIEGFRPVAGSPVKM